MIAVEVGDQDGANRVRVDSEFAHCDHRGSTTVHEKGSPPIPDVKASVEAPPASEGIAGTHKLDFHATSHPCVVKSKRSHILFGAAFGKLPRTVSARQTEEPIAIGCPLDAQTLLRMKVGGPE
jgi:hypothetical protein